MKHFDENITWGGLHNNPHSATVRVQIFDQVTTAGSSGHRKVIILTEPEDNPGTSVTNGVEQIATRVLRDHGIDFYSAQFVEHYDRPTIGRKKEKETFDLVYFELNDRGECKRPNWTPSDWEHIANLIGEQGKQWHDI
jgi:hypothetical protein